MGLRREVGWPQESPLSSERLLPGRGIRFQPGLLTSRAL